MTQITFRSDMTVRTTRVEGSDLDVCLAAWVSTLGDELEQLGLLTEGEVESDRMKPERQQGLINFLMRDRHGSPFEQCGFQFLTSAPIFVWREHMRHRVGSYNEESGRYRKLRPVFYNIAPDRNLVQVGKPGAYTFQPGTPEQYQQVRDDLMDTAIRGWHKYERELSMGIAKEVARMNLPNTIYSTAYFRVNLRSLMNLLSLRTKKEWATYPSFPMREIELVADLYETSFIEHFPLTWGAFTARGRVAP